jgi:hypothetical protein
MIRRVVELAECEGPGAASARLGMRGERTRASRDIENYLTVATDIYLLLTPLLGYDTFLLPITRDRRRARAQVRFPMQRT